MVEPVSTAAAVWAGYKVVGPALDGIGAWLASFIPERQKNGKRILDNAQLKAEGRIGSASPRVVARALDEGSWSSDEIVAAYLGGSIAGSVHASGDDDTTLPWVKLINRLSVDALAAHHAVYEAIHRLRSAAGESFNPGQETELRAALGLYVPEGSISRIFDESARFEAAVRVLELEGLISEWQMGSNSDLKKVPTKLELPADGHGLYSEATHHGISLFMVGYGFSGMSSARDFMTTDDLGRMVVGEADLPVFEGALLAGRR